MSDLKFFAAVARAAFRDCLNLALAPVDRVLCRFANVTDEGDAAVWEFARQFARTSGDSPTCQCVNCRAYRAVRDHEGDA